MTFIVWGLYYGFFLILERVFLENLLNKGSKVISRVYLITTVLFGWVFFRAEDMDQAFSYALNMLQFDSFDLSILDIQPFAAAAFITGATIALFPPQILLYKLCGHSPDKYKIICSKHVIATPVHSDAVFWSQKPIHLF